MSFSFSAHNVNSLTIDNSHDHGNGMKSFTLALTTDCDFYGKDRATITLFVDPSFVSKFERIAAFIAAINAEPDDAHAAASTPLVEAFAAE